MGAASQGQGDVKADCQSQGLASVNDKGQRQKGGVETAQQNGNQLLPGVDTHEFTEVILAETALGTKGLKSQYDPTLFSGEPLDSSGFSPVCFENEWELARSWECEELRTTGPQVVDVQGRLRQHLPFWVNVLKAPTPVIDWIENGYRLPLQFMPTPFDQGNHKSTSDHINFVTQSVEGLLNNRCVWEVKTKPMVCSPLSVVSNHEGKYRLV